MNKNARAGFSMIELSIYMGILAILILVLTDIAASILNVTLSYQSTSSVSRDGRYIYSRLIYDINRAESASQPASLGDTTQAMQLTISGKNYDYAISGDNLTLTEETGSYILNSPDTRISNLEFTRIGNTSGKHTFRINFDVISKINVNNRFETAEFQTTAGLR